LQEQFFKMETIKKSLRDSNIMRWSVLLSVSFVMAANYFFYDVLSPLQSLLREKLSFSNSEYGFLVSAYSLPNVFLLMAIVGGVILDKIGIRITGFVFIAFMAIGSLLTGYGSSAFFNNGGPGFHFFGTFLTQYSPAMKMMTFGYFLFGLGAETSIVVITKIVVKWFKGKELAFALGLNLSVARMGTMMAFLFSKTLAQQSPWYKPIFLGAGLLSIALLSFLVYVIFDMKIDKQIKEDQGIAPEEKFRLSDIGKIIKIPSFIYITLLCVTFYSAVFTFIKYSPDLLENKFGFSGELSGLIVAILPFGTILFTPLFGLFTDYKGKSASVMILGSLLLILVHLTFTFTRISPYIPMFILGVAFSLVPAAMWPSLAKIIENNKIGTAYGIMFSIQNIGLWLFPILIGKILDVSNPNITQEMVNNHEAYFNYTNPMLMLSFLGILGIIFAFLLKREDKVSGFGLELPNRRG
jgi:MFS family permease